MTGPTSNNDGASRRARSDNEEAPVHVQNCANSGDQEIVTSQLLQFRAETRQRSCQRRAAETSLYWGAGCVDYDAQCHRIAGNRHRRKWRQHTVGQCAASDVSTLREHARDRINHCHFTITGIATEQRRNKRRHPARAQSPLCRPCECFPSLCRFQGRLTRCAHPGRPFRVLGLAVTNPVRELLSREPRRHRQRSGHAQ